MVRGRRGTSASRQARTKSPAPVKSDFIRYIYCIVQYESMTETTKPMGRTEAEKLLRGVPGWSISAGGQSLVRQFTFKNFVEAMDFANKITPIAESAGPHPGPSLGWGRGGGGPPTHPGPGRSGQD